MNIFLIRHGQGRHQTEHYIGGWKDFELTEKGRAQARAVAKRLKDLIGGSVTIVSSDILRALETAEIIAGELGKEVISDPLLREISQGIVEGQLRDEALKVKRPVTRPVLDWRPYPEAETWREFDERVAKFMEKVPSFETRNLIVVSHFQTTVSILHNIFDMTDEQKSITDFRIDNCSLTIVEYHGDLRFVRTLNDISHLIDVNQSDHKTSETIKANPRD